MGCRDCAQCTELGIKTLVMSPIRAFAWVLFSWNIGLFQRRCPECGHRMKLHARRSDGSFRD